MMKLRLAAFGAGLLLSCGEAEDYPERIVTTPVALEGHVAWGDLGNDDALFLNVSTQSPAPTVESVELPGTPTLLQRRNEHDELLVLTAGEDDEHLLLVVTPDGVDRSYEVGTRFNALTQSDDGAYAIAHYSANRGMDEEDDTLLFNPNEIAIIELDRDGEDGVTQRTLRSLGAAPSRFVFSPEMELASETRRLAVVLFNSELALLDLSHPERVEYTIEVSQGSNLRLNQVRFSPEDDKIFVLAQGSSDIYVLQLSTAGSNRVNDFEPSLNPLGTDGSPRDMALFDYGSGERVLVAGGNSAQIVEASSSRVTQIPLVHAATSILMFEGTAPFSDEVQQRAVLYSESSVGLTFLDLSDIEERTTRNREELNLPSSIQSFIPLRDNTVLLTHDGGGLSVLDLQERTASSIQARFNAQQAVPDLVTNRLWVASTSTSQLGFVDLDNLHPGEIKLDDPIANLLLFSELDAPKVVVTHRGREGQLSVLDAQEPNGDEAITLRGFFQEGALDL